MSTGGSRQRPDTAETLPAPTRGTGWAAEVTDLTVQVGNGRTIVDSVTLKIAPGSILGLLGESGSGKTTVAMALLGYVRAGARITGGRIMVAGTEIERNHLAALTAVRGSVVSYVPQDPRAAFNPALRIGAQLIECLAAAAPELTHSQRHARAAETLHAVGLSADEAWLRRFPHQLSGGQLQRVGIALAVAPRPRVVVWDEPTTGLDVITQHRILQLVRSLCSQYQIAGLYVTHDLAVLPNLADSLAVMRNGVVVEQGSTEAVLRNPEHGYTQQLLASVPRFHHVGDRRVQSASAPEAQLESAAARPLPNQDRSARASVLEVSQLVAAYRGKKVLDGVNVQIASGECVAVVGESGSGKTTLSRSLIGLHHEHSGEIRLHGRPLAARAADRTRDQRRQLQYIFQSPHSALNPRATVLDSIVFARKTVTSGSREEHHRAALHALQLVELGADVGGLLPTRLSGGERQRVAIARALVTEPELIICDEITSALDVIVQRRIMDLLMNLRDETGISYLFVTHNIALVSDVADRVLVLHEGRVEESGPTTRVLQQPESRYVKELVAFTPTLESVSQGKSNTP